MATSQIQLKYRLTSTQDCTTPTTRPKPASTTAKSRLTTPTIPSVSTKRRLSTLARQTLTPLPSSVSLRPKLTATTRLTRSITKAMVENTLPPAANAIPPVAVSNVASTTTTPTKPFPLSLSDLNIHSVPNLPDYLKDIYARLDSQASQISEMQALIQENLRSSLDQTKKQLEDAQQRIRQLESQQAPQSFLAPESTAASPSPITMAQPSFADVAKKQADPSAVKRPKAKTIPRKRLQPLNLNVTDASLAAARQFLVVSPNHGY
ncbi:uncharacterized protein ATC70_011169 [Mucor velutinosus]|uniref:Uncharacterized protein n=1 Tax=Mucor velutinosus TaxID=708070 RepID=A0AAN7HTI7_9FUNG|nr:hypothetical protein ATC70_011169 [Mucor velutinosus]